MPLKALVVSHLVNACIVKRAAQYTVVQSLAILVMSSSLCLLPVPVSNIIRIPKSAA